MVRSPLTFEISSASNLAFHRAMVTPSSSGKMTSIGSSAIARSRKRTEVRPFGRLALAVTLNIPQRAFAVDGLARHAEPPGGFVPIAAGLLQHGKNMTPLDLFEALRRRATRFTAPRLKVARKSAEDQRALDEVAQLADIARPI